MKKTNLIVLVLGFLLLAQPVSAHVTVKPAEVGVAARTNFTVSVPTEKDNPTTGVRLVIPEGVQNVRPNVKPGWTITLTKTGEGEDVKVTEINWTGGFIPADQRDEFIFSAQVPAETTTLDWKAYQTYSDGSLVSWDHAPEMEHGDGAEEDENSGPLSQTKVINDLNGDTATVEKTTVKSNNYPLILSVLALVLAGGSWWMQLQKKRS